MPVLRVNAAQSLVPLPVRQVRVSFLLPVFAVNLVCWLQTMLKTLYDHFIVLYRSIHPSNPSLASEHALRQEEEVYKKSTKLTYRNVSMSVAILQFKNHLTSFQAVIQCVSSIKRREIPTSINHPSVGTENDVITRAEAQKSLESLHLSRDRLDSLVHSVEELKKWGYHVDIPSGPGGEQPSLEGKLAKCDRCTQPFLVKREVAETCIYHWGKPYNVRVNGQ